MSQSSVAYRKSKEFASRIVKMYLYLKEKKQEHVLLKQVLRSGTSIGANLAEAVWGSSRADFLAKVNIALKESHEKMYWIELLGDNGFLTKKTYESPPANFQCNGHCTINADKHFLVNKA